MSVGNSDLSMGFSNPVLEALELVNVCILEPIPQENWKTVSVQGRLCKHAKFWLDDLNASSFVRDIHVVFYGYRLPFAILPWHVINHCLALQHVHFVVSAIAEFFRLGALIV